MHSQPAALRHVPALDGLRGVAVAGVLLFHADHLMGGFLGVDLFFTLSGFLITTILLQEATRTGAIRLGAFWARRARRLLPALLALLLAVAVYAAVWARPDGTRCDPQRCLRNDGLRRELALDLRRARLLGSVRGTLAVPPHVEPRHRRAVLPRVAAARDPARAMRALGASTPAGAARSLGGARRRLARVDGRSLPARS